MEDKNKKIEGLDGQYIDGLQRVNKTFPSAVKEPAAAVKPEQPETVSDDGVDYYQELKNENYKTLLDREIQLDNARARALKSTNASLNAQGFGSSGYGQLNRLGIESQYLQGLEGAQNAYQTENNAINMQQAQEQKAEADRLAMEQQTAGNERYKTIANFMSSVYDDDETSIEDLNKVLSEYGLMDENGNWLTESSSYKNLTDSQREDLAALYSYFKSGYGRRTEDITNPEQNQNVDLKSAIDSAAKAKVQDELNWLTKDGAKISKNFREGDYIKLSDNVKDKNQIYYVYKGGELVEVSKDEYEKGQHKYWVRSHENNKDMIVDYDGKTIYNNNSTNRNGETALGALASVLAGILTGGVASVPVGAASYVGGKSKAAMEDSEVSKNYEDYLKLLGGN